MDFTIIFLHETEVVYLILLFNFIENHQSFPLFLIKERHVLLICSLTPLGHICSKPTKIHQNNVHKYTQEYSVCLFSVCGIISLSRLLTLFFPIIPLRSPRKHWQAKIFLMFSGGPKVNIWQKRVKRIWS